MHIYTVYVHRYARIRKIIEKQARFVPRIFVSQNNPMSEELASKLVERISGLKRW